MVRKFLLMSAVPALLCGGLFGSCSAPQNPIEGENCNAGTIGWRVPNPDSSIQGFATDISLNAGQTVNFKVSTSATNYNITIFRLGYYQGNGARQIATVTPSAKLPQTQPACLSDSSTNLVDCGNWAVSASWTIPSSVVPGIYVADLVRSDTGGANQIFFVVRDDTSHSDILFQTADESWQAYNGYGGHSLYGATGFDLTNRANKVSYNRPFAWIESQTQPLYAEYPMVRWLEANGYDVSYFSSVDSARNGSLIKNHKLFLSVGHDEYVSGPKRANIETARDAGVNLAFFSGNEFFWKTRWENSIDGTNTPYRNLACYKETLGPNSNPAATAAVDPQDPPTWTGTWRDPTKSPPADGGRPENALTGQLFRVNGPGSDNSNLSIKVPAAMGKLRFWRNTPNVSTQSAGSTWTLPASTLGYEWDVEEDNGSRPAGLFDLSSATYNLTTDYLQDYGGVYGAGTATHKLSTYRAPSGALVFGAGTVQWSFGLDSSSGGTTDTNMQQATVNLFADMGVQPATLQSGLLSATKTADTTPPASTITAPANGTSVQAGSTVSVTGTATDVAGQVAGVEVSVDSGATWHPATGTTSWSYSWVANTGGTFTVLSRAVDDSANLETPSGGVSVNIIGVASLTASPASLSGASSSQGTVTLSAPAGSGGATVTLTSSVPSVVIVPNSVVVPTGTTTVIFPITTNAVGSSINVTISAKYASTATTTLTVNAVFPPSPGVVDIDATVSTHQGTSSSTITSGVFSTLAGNELVLALISSDALQSGMTVSGVTGSGLTWSLVQRTDGQTGTAEIWRAFAASVLTNVAATATFSQSSPSASITIITFAGVDTTGTNGSGAIGSTASGSGATGAPTASFTTTRNNSWVIGVGADNTNAIARAVGANQTLIDSYLSPLGDTFWSQRQNALIPGSGTSVTINDTAPATDSYNLAIVEVRPPIVGSYSVSGNLSTTGSGATVALSGAMTQSVTADASGNYSFGSLISGSYTVSPSKVGYVFTPASQTVTINSSNISNLNFSAAQTFSISGNITPSSSGNGATVALSGAASATTTADASGNYMFSGLLNGSYTVVPSKVGFSFSPGSQPINVNGSNVSSVNFAATQQGFSISGNLSANGANATVALSGAVTANTTADASGNYSFAGLNNGSYIVTPSKSGFTFTPTSQNATISAANVTGLNFTAQVVATTNLATDVKISKDGTAASSSISSTAFSTTSGNELLLAFISADYLGGANTTVTSVTGGGLTWTLVSRANQQSGDSEIWRGFAPAPLTNITVSANLSQSVVSSITVISYTGVDTTGTNGSGAVGATASKGATTGSPSVSVVTTRSNSWVFGIGNDFDNAIARTPSSGQSLVHQLLTSAGDTYWVQMQNSATALSGTSATISDTGPTSDRWNLAAVEVLPSQGGATTFAISGTISPTTAGSGSTVTLTQSGSTIATTSADTSGNYSFANLQNGSYTVTPSKSGFNFSPASQAVTINGASVSSVNFASAAQTWTVAGNISPATSGIPVTLSGSSSGSTTTDSSGNYTFTGLANGAYTVTPSQSGKVFSPSSLQVTVNGANSTSNNFTWATAPTWTISGSVAPALTGVNMALTGPVTLNTTTDTSGNFSFSGLANGTYTVTPSLSGYVFTPNSQSATVNGANASATFTDQVVSAVALGIDVQVSADAQTASASVSSPTFSTKSANELLLAFVSADYLSGTNTTVTGISGGGLTWVLVQRANVRSGTAEIWRAFAASALANATVKATLSQSVASTVTILSFTGVDATGTNGSGAIGTTNTASAATGAPLATLLTTRGGSWVFGVGEDYDRATARTPSTNQSLVHQDLSSTGDTYWVQMQNSPTPNSGTSVTINDTAPTTDQFNLAIVEVLPSTSASSDTTPPTVSMISPAPSATVATLQTLTASASDNVKVASVQFRLDGSNLGSAISSPPYEFVWDSTAVAAGTHTISAVAVDPSGNVGTSSPVTITIDHSGSTAVVGSWSSPVTLPAVAVNLILLKNNKLLFYQDGSTPQVWDYVNNTFSSVPTSADLFCSGHANLVDGRVLVVGGYGGNGSAMGIRNAEIFDPGTNSWTTVPSMNYARWYPSATTLADGRILVTAGWQTTEHTNAGIPEIYDPSASSWTKLTNANNAFETYPFIYLLPDGRLVHVGGSEYATVTETLDINSQAWTTVDSNIVDGSSSKMYLPYKVMKAGTAADSQMTGPAANSAYIIDMSQTTPKWQQIPSMAYSRSFMNMTELPDGTVLATGGETDKNGGNIANAVYAAELWNPQTQTWTTMSSMQKPREYHGTALLLPDGRVVVSGMGADFGNVPDQLSAEFFSPPYLFKGARPTVSQAPTQMSYGQTYTVTTPDAANIAKAVLIRNGAVTHFFDQNTYYVPLSFTQIAGGLTVTAPSNGNAAPPGYYMLFLVNSSGVPSVATFVQVIP